MAFRYDKLTLKAQEGILPDLAIIVNICACPLYHPLLGVSPGLNGYDIPRRGGQFKPAKGANYD